MDPIFIAIPESRLNYTKNQVNERVVYLLGKCAPSQSVGEGRGRRTLWVRVPFSEVAVPPCTVFPSTPSEPTMRALGASK